MDFEAYLNDLPLLHTWDGGQTWNTGGFTATQLRRIHEIVSAEFPDRPVHVLETGAGNSTITFLQLNLERLVSIAPAGDLRDRILACCADREIDAAPLDFRVARSEMELPTLALPGGSEQTPRFDVSLIDGGHGWPTVFVDFCYCNAMMGKGSLLLLDDLQLYSVAELSRLLEQQPNFRLREQLGKLQVWGKTNDEPFLPGHLSEPYIMQMSRPAPTGQGAC